MTKNIRISLFILAPIVLWMISGFFVKDKEVQVFEKAGFECIADYNYNIDVEVPSGKVNEKSYIFVLRRSQVPIAETFKNKYGIEIND